MKMMVDGMEADRMAWNHPCPLCGRLMDEIVGGWRCPGCWCEELTVEGVEKLKDELLGKDDGGRDEDDG